MKQRVPTFHEQYKAAKAVKELERLRKENEQLKRELRRSGDGR